MNWKKRALRNRVEKRIREAFKGVKLGEGYSLHQQILVSNYGCDEEGNEVSGREWERLRTAGVIDNWEKIDWSREPDDEHISMVFLYDKGQRYYLPALMLRLLDKYDSSSMRVISTLSFLYPRKNDKQISWESYSSNYSVFTHEQMAAIGSFLNALPILLDLETRDRRIVQRAVENYWHRFVPEEDEELLR
ncbi:MAG: hypothetical protein J5I65_18185 [Aridibacter famidurans]|nr:hypothetical protein [Aridibacter famidurans]